MLSRIRKFSNTIYAKIFLFIVAIPFVFWGMGDLFNAGNQNTIVKISNEKISAQEFMNFVNLRANSDEVKDDGKIDNLLSKFIGEKLIEREIEDFNIKISDDSLRNLIINEKIFKKGNNFSRIKYEKFLVENSIDAITFENNMKMQEEKKQLFDLIGGGLIPTNFLINLSFNKINQKRYVEIINLNEAVKNNLKFTNLDIENYYKENIKNFSKNYKTFKILELNPKNLTVDEEFTDLYFKKIDEIDDLIADEKKIKFIIKKYNLAESKNVSINKLGLDENNKKIKNLPIGVVDKIFNLSKEESTALIENKGKYFVFEFIKNKEIQRMVVEPSVKDEILEKLKRQKKGKIITDIINKINNNNFSKVDFKNFANEKKLLIKKTKLESQNDNKDFNQELLNQIYMYPEKRVIVVADLGLSKSYLIFIDKIENVTINKESNDYNKFSNLTKVSLMSGIYNTYDLFLKNKYEIDINYQTLERIKNLVK